MKIEAIDFGCGCQVIPGDRAGTVSAWAMKHCPMHKAAPELYAAYKFGLESNSEEALIKASLLNDPGVPDEYAVRLTFGGRLYGRLKDRHLEDPENIKRLTEDLEVLRQEMDDAIRKIALSMLSDWLRRVDREHHRMRRKS